MKNLFIALILLIFGNLVAQSHHFYYNVTYRPDSLSSDMKKEMMILDISKDDIKFYSKAHFIIDSLAKENKIPNFLASDLNIRLKRKMGSYENFNYLSPSPVYYFLLKTNDKQDWKLSQETKKIGELNVQKATTIFGGRDWEAWFCPDIPFPQGPYKFQGLPGLILDIKDTKGDYHFSFIKNINLPQTTDTTYIIEKKSPWDNVSPIEISETRWKKLQLEYFSNPLKDLGNNSQIMLQNNNNTTQKIDLKEASKLVQQRLLKRNK